MLTNGPPSVWRLGSWPTILLFGALLFVVYALGAFWVEPYSGSCMFVLLAFFTALIVVLPMRLVGRFGVGAAVYLPWALLGLPIEYYFEWVAQPLLVGPWAVVLWCAVGPACSRST